MDLIIPIFFAGILTFLAPCTLPIVPAYLAFISGVSLEEAKKGNFKTKFKILLNACAYCLGFSVIFIFFGILFGLGGSYLIQYRGIINRVGGVFILTLGLYMTGILKIPFFDSERTPKFISKLKPGTLLSSFLFGAIFASGWSPCVGPILGSVLLLASQSATVFKGAILLSVFSLGISIPFILVSLSVGYFSKLTARFSNFVSIFSKISGIFLCLIGLLIIFNQFGVFVGFFYKLFDFFGYEKLLNYL
ncbi:MAG: cytochrome c biogenesis protein CcdA [Candidatus Pacebacteria bacterium]|nr:cytochrome c biogenesis protein CcdA [Candidatus Paceibacterota bacterium]